MSQTSSTSNPEREPKPEDRREGAAPAPGSEAAGEITSETGGETVPTLDLEQVAEMEERIVHALKSCYDPEIPVDIYELGLIYDVEVLGGGKVHVKMTLTSPACPVAGSLPGEVEQKVQGVEGVEEATVELVWEPPWNPGMMSDAARLDLGMF